MWKQLTLQGLGLLREPRPQTYVLYRTKYRTWWFENHLWKFIKYLLTATDGASATVNAISSSLTSSKSGIIGIPSSSSDPIPPWISAAILTLLAVWALEASSAQPPVLRPRGGGGRDELSSRNKTMFRQVETSLDKFRQVWICNLIPICISLELNMCIFSTVWTLFSKKEDYCLVLLQVKKDFGRSNLFCLKWFGPTKINWILPKQIWPTKIILDL